MRKAKNKSNVRKKSLVDYFNCFPPEIGEKVLSHLNPTDLIRVSRVNQKFHQLCQNSMIWKKKCQEAGITAKTLDYKSFVIRKLKLKSAWRKGPLPKAKILKGHKENVSLIQINEDLLITLSWDRTIKIWNKGSTKPRFTLQGHTELMSDAKLTPCGKLVTTSYDNSVKIWDSGSGSLIRTLEGHQDGVVCVDVYKNTIVSGSRDRRLILWDLLSGDQLGILSDHPSIVNCVKFNGVRVVSGDEDGCVKIWDPINLICLKTLNCHTMTIASLLLQNNFVVSFSNQKQICIYDMTKDVCNHKVKTIRASPGKGQHLGNIIPLAFDKFSIKLWDISTGQVVQTLSGPDDHDGQICGVAMTDSFILTSGCEGKVKLWDISTGHFIRDVVSLKKEYLTNISVTETSLVGVLHLRNGARYTDVFSINFEDVVDNENKKVLRPRKLKVKN